ncbi:hypothetical protein SEA_CHASER_138 [Mycobacterium phage Chaser]|nr:hypothetical protein SEA_CHASER_138 [Mycobacterium phage Chaser]
MSSEPTYTALVLHLDGTHDVITVPRRTELATFRALVNGDIEAVYGWTPAAVAGDGAFDVTFYGNDMSRILNQPENVQATALWWSLNPHARGVDHLRGVVVVTGGANQDGDTLSVPERVVEVVRQAGGE